MLYSIRKLFRRGNVCVTGLRGTGKDMLFANIIEREKKPYISNVNYKCSRSIYIPLDFKKLDVLNNYDNLVNDKIVPYEYPYPENVDIYLSDAGVYFPAQYCNDLNKKYANMPIFQALSRQLGNCNFHVNVQNLNRCWDKIREQSDIYIRCIDCKVLGNLVFQRVIIYDQYDACLARVEPYRHVVVPVFCSTEQRALMRTKDEELYRQFREKNGSVHQKLLVYLNRSKYDTRLFKKILGGHKRG